MSRIEWTHGHLKSSSAILSYPQTEHREASKCLEDARHPPVSRCQVRSRSTRRRGASWFGTDQLTAVDPGHVSRAHEPVPGHHIDVLAPTFGTPAPVHRPMESASVG